LHYSPIARERGLNTNNSVFEINPEVLQSGIENIAGLAPAFKYGPLIGQLLTIPEIIKTPIFGFAALVCGEASLAVRM
jgi:hypothetical protein